MVTANYLKKSGNITRITAALVVCSLQFTPLLIFAFSGYIPFGAWLLWKSKNNACSYQNFAYICSRYGNAVSKTYWHLEALCSLVNWKPRKFSIEQTRTAWWFYAYIAWTVISILFVRVFLGPPIKAWHTAPRFFVIISVLVLAKGHLKKLWDL